MERTDRIQTESQELDNFSRILNAYTAELKRLKAGIENAIHEMRHCWKDKQYNHVSDVLSDSMRQLNKQLSDLDFINKLVQKKRQIIRRAE